VYLVAFYNFSIFSYLLVASSFSKEKWTKCNEKSHILALTLHSFNLYSAKFHQIKLFILSSQQYPISQEHSSNCIAIIALIFIIPFSLSTQNDIVNVNELKIEVLIFTFSGSTQLKKKPCLSVCMSVCLNHTVAVLL